MYTSIVVWTYRGMLRELGIPSYGKNPSCDFELAGGTYGKSAESHAGSRAILTASRFAATPTPSMDLKSQDRVV